MGYRDFSALKLLLDRWTDEILKPYISYTNRWQTLKSVFYITLECKLKNKNHGDYKQNYSRNEVGF